MKNFETIIAAIEDATITKYGFEATETLKVFCLGEDARYWTAKEREGFTNAAISDMEEILENGL